MDRFDSQIAMLKPTTNPAQLNERQFMKKLTLARRAIRVRRMFMVIMMLAAAAIIGGAVRRDMADVLTLTFRYLGELPSMLTEYTNAYLATLSWPGVVSLAILAVLGTLLFRSRKDVTAILNGRLYKPAVILGGFALVLGIVGMFLGSSQAAAHQEALRRGLNERGHLEVRVDGRDYELNAQSRASDDSIRNQAFIEELRNFDIATAYPELKNMNREGFVAEIRAVNSKDDCVFYVERRLEPALNQVMDASTSCIRNADQFPIYYLSPQLKPIKAPSWKVGQAAYFSSAQKKEATQTYQYMVGIVVLLDGKADHYVARNNSEKVVPKGQPSGGVQPCGIGGRESCPVVGYIDVFTNAEGRMASGEIGSSVPGDSLRPRPGSEVTRMLGKIVAFDGRMVRVETLNGQKMAITWPRNIIQEFNTGGARNYQDVNGPLQVVVGDHLVIDISYKQGMDLQQLQISDVHFIGLALKTAMPDPLENEQYSKNKERLEKY